MLQFFQDMRNEFKKGNNVSLKMSGVENITPEAIAVLLSKMKDRRYTFDMRCTGNEPRNNKAKEVLAQSGFYDFVTPIKNASIPRKHDSGSITKRKSKRVEGKVAKELITFATEKIYGKRKACHPFYRTLIECMQNTRNHAAGGSQDDVQSETWWATVYVNEDNKKASFTFVDNGVGIIRSLKFKHIFKTAQSKMKKDSSLLEELLKGEIGSSTLLNYRGKGLPKMFQDSKTGNLSNLIIMSNRVFAFVEKENFVELSHPFYGTLIYWEFDRQEQENEQSGNV